MMKASNFSKTFSAWTGTKEITTLQFLLTYGLKDMLKVFTVDIDNQYPYYLLVKRGLHINDFVNKLKSIQFAADDPNTVLSERQDLFIDKYDFMVPKILLRTAFLANQLNIPATLQILVLHRFNP